LRERLTSIQKGRVQMLMDKTRFPAPDSRSVYGIPDTSGKLQYGQCFLKISFHTSNIISTLVVTGRVAITKNPCLHPGDVRVLEAVDIPELHHKSDCIVFPVKGNRPHTDEICGSDLDGDMFFVTWNKKTHQH